MVGSTSVQQCLVKAQDSHPGPDAIHSIACARGSTDPLLFVSTHSGQLHIIQNTQRLHSFELAMLSLQPSKMVIHRIHYLGGLLALLAQPNNCLFVSSFSHEHISLSPIPLLCLSSGGAPITEICAVSLDTNYHIFCTADTRGIASVARLTLVTANSVCHSNSTLQTANTGNCEILGCASAQIQAHSGPCTAITCIPRDSLATLVTGGGPQDPTIKLWQVRHTQDPKILCVVPEATLRTGVSVSVVNAFQSYIFAGTNQGTLHVWNNHQQLLVDKTAPLCPITAIVVCPPHGNDSGLLMTGNGDGILRLYRRDNINAWKLVAQVSLGSPITSITVSLDASSTGYTLFAACLSGQIKSWNQTSLPQFPPPDTIPTNSQEHIKADKSTTLNSDKDKKVRFTSSVIDKLDSGDCIPNNCMNQQATDKILTSSPSMMQKCATKQTLASALKRTNRSPKANESNSSSPYLRKSNAIEKSPTNKPKFKSSNIFSEKDGETLQSKPEIRLETTETKSCPDMDRKTNEINSSSEKVTQPNPALSSAVPRSVLPVPFQLNDKNIKSIRKPVSTAVPQDIKTTKANSDLRQPRDPKISVPTPISLESAQRLRNAIKNNNSLSQTIVLAARKHSKRKEPAIKPNFGLTWRIDERTDTKDLSQPDVTAKLMVPSDKQTPVEAGKQRVNTEKSTKISKPFSPRERFCLQDILKLSDSPLSPNFGIKASTLDSKKHSSPFNYDGKYLRDILKLSDSPFTPNFGMKTSKRVSNKDLSSFQFGEYVLTSDNHFPDKHEPEPRLYVAEVTSPIDEELEYFLEMTKTDVNCTSTHSKLPTDIPNDFELIEKYFKETAKDERPKSEPKKVSKTKLVDDTCAQLLLSKQISDSVNVKSSHNSHDQEASSLFGFDAMIIAPKEMVHPDNKGSSKLPWLVDQGNPTPQRTLADYFTSPTAALVSKEQQHLNIQLEDTKRIVHHLPTHEYTDDLYKESWWNQPI